MTDKQLILLKIRARLVGRELTLDGCLYFMRELLLQRDRKAYPMIKLDNNTFFPEMLAFVKMWDVRVVGTIDHQDEEVVQYFYDFIKQYNDK